MRMSQLYKLRYLRPPHDKDVDSQYRTGIIIHLAAGEQLKFPKLALQFMSWQTCTRSIH